MTICADSVAKKHTANQIVPGKARVTWTALASVVPARPGVRTDAQYSLETRFKNGKGASPEELLAAAHAGCFTMAVASSLQASGYPPIELNTEATITQEGDGTGYRIAGSALSLHARVRNVTRQAFETIAWEAANNCSISRVLRTQIRLDVKLL